MPKRIVDGEGVWHSDKLAQVRPVRYRAEFANLVPLALANGTFECNPIVIWATVYAYNRPDITQEDVVAILDEYERVKLLFRWTTTEGKTWGYWVSINKPGRLPSPSQVKNQHYPTGEIPPADMLQEFLSQPADVPTDKQGLPPARSMPTHGLRNASLGIGVGTGTGVGEGTGESAHSPVCGQDAGEEKNPEVDDSRTTALMVEVSEIASQTPSPKSRAAASALLTQYAPEEILAAFREHMGDLLRADDSFALKRCIDTFFQERGGDIVILKRRKRAETRQAEQAMMGRQVAEMQREREAESEQEEADRKQADDELAELLKEPEARAAAGGRDGD